MTAAKIAFALCIVAMGSSFISSYQKDQERHAQLAAFCASPATDGKLKLACITQGTADGSQASPQG